MAENKGNPYHDEEGKFTSGGNQTHGKLDSEKRNPFKKKGPSPVNEDELSSSWMDLFGLGQKIIDEHKSDSEWEHDEEHDEDFERSWGPARDEEEDEEIEEAMRKFHIGTEDGRHEEEIEANSLEEAEKIAQEKFGSHAGGDEVFVEEIEKED